MSSAFGAFGSLPLSNLKRAVIRPRRFLLGAYLLGGSLLLAGGVHAQTLDQALTAAYENNPTLQAERAQVRSTDEGVPQSLGRWRPTVELVGSLGYDSTTTDPGNNSDSRSFYSGAAQVTQNLYEGGGTTARVAQSEALVKAARARLLDTEQTVLLQTVSAFMDVVRDRAVLALNQQNEERLKRQLEATRDRFEVGEVTRTDVAQAESRVSGAQADRIAAKGNLEVSRAAYQQVVGELPGNLTSPTDFPAIPSGRDEAISLAQDRNPSVIAAIFDLESAKHFIRVEAADLLPTVDLVGLAQANRDVARKGTDTDAFRVTATVTVPIYQQGIATSEIREARQDAARAQRLIDEAQRLAIEDATAAWETYQSALAQIRAREDEVRATSIALEGVEQEAAVGSRTVLDVLDAEQELLDARVNLVQAQRDEIVARYDLIAAVGGMNAIELQLPVRGYDVEFYYNAVRNSIYDLGTWNEIFPGLVERGDD